MRVRGNSMSHDRNGRGPIAASYDELQAIDLLKLARAATEVPKRSRASALRAVLQAFELLLLNLADLCRRATTDISRGDLDRAAVKSDWCAGLNKLCADLSLVACSVAPEYQGSSSSPIGFRDSPALAAYVACIRALDEATAELVDARRAYVDEMVANASSDAAIVRFLHNVGVCCHEGAIWERTLIGVRLLAPRADYSAFIASDTLSSAVSDLELEGDTYFAQFRCLHQVPELLAFEANEHLEGTVLALRDGNLALALHYLASANDLVTGIVASLSALIESLVIADYHAIRENLGVTSGSHSVSLRYHLGRDLYRQVGEALAAVALSGGKGAQPVVAWTSQQPPSIWTSLFREALRLRLLLAQWRQRHLHLPRSNLGADMTRSLAGSPDAIHTATSMRDEAERDDPLSALAEAFGLPHGQQQVGPLEAHVRDSSSLDCKILELKGALTKARFPDVQNRTGHFSLRAQFHPPPRREI